MSCLSPLFVPPVPRKLQLKRTESLRIEWSDGVLTTYPLDYLRSMCPCATCRSIRETPKPAAGKSLSLRVLPGNFQASAEVKGAELVGNYALRIDWSDGHDSGIYSFEYLRQIGASLTNA